MKKLFYKLFGLSLLGFLWLWFLGINSVEAQFWDPTLGTQYNPTVVWSDWFQNDKLIVTIKNFVNRVLGILALIALIILLRGWFQMVTAAGDDGKYKNWFKILKQAAFGLAFIWLAWLMVSVIFWLIGIITT